MSWDTFVALIVFAFVSSVTPGPNNLMLLASGVNFGFWRTVPHMFGISIGFLALLLSVGFGLGFVFEQSPTLFLGLKIAGGLYLLYLAWRIANTRSIDVGNDGNEKSQTPMSFFAAALFQWVNPKAWVMAVAAMAAYPETEARALGVLIVGFTFTIVNLPSVSVWCSFGISMRELLTDPVRLKWFNITMGGLLVLSLWPILS